MHTLYHDIMTFAHRDLISSENVQSGGEPHVPFLAYLTHRA